MKYKKLYSILLLFIVVLISIFISHPLQEFFENKEKVITSQRLNFEKELTNYKLQSFPPSGWEYILFKLYTQQPIDIYGNPKKVIMEPIDYLENVKTKPFTVLPQGMFLLLTTPGKQKDFSCGYDFTNKTIGYFDRLEKRFIESIAYGYRTQLDSKQLSMDILDKLTNAFSMVDMIVVYVLPKSPLFTLIETQELTVLSMSGIDIQRLKISNPYLELQQSTFKEWITETAKLRSPAETVLYITLSLYLVELDSSIRETFITRLEHSPEYLDPNYKCVGNETITSKYLCMSPYDVTGEPKNGITTWDKPCTTNTECPFYKANKNYPNEFGGCKTDKTCDMPVGMIRLGYRSFTGKEPYQPFCYQCKPTDGPNCCELQENLVKNTMNQPNAPPLTYLKSPDYAFANDTKEREQYNMPLYIPVL